MADKGSNEEVLGLKPDFQPYWDRSITYNGLVKTLHDVKGKPMISYQNTFSMGFLDVQNYVSPEQLERWRGRWSR